MAKTKVDSKTGAQRQAEYRANKVAQGYCTVCAKEKPKPPKTTCETCLQRLKERYTPKTINISQAREIYELLQNSNFDDPAYAIRQAVNKILSRKP